MRSRVLSSRVVGPARPLLAVAIGLTVLTLRDAEGAPAAVLPTIVSEAQLFGHGDPAGAALLGSSVSVDGDTALVGAPRTLGPDGQAQGAAYVFVRSGRTWTQQAKLLPSDGGAVVDFGRSVSLSGDTAAVAASGGVYVFVRSDGAWTLEQKLTAADPTVSAVSLSGNTLVFGTPYEADRGAAYVFIRYLGTWLPQGRLVPSDAEGGYAFGFSLSVSEDTVVVGRPGTADGLGAAYVFVRSGGTWAERQRLAGGVPAEFFGISVSSSGGTIAVGGRGYNFLAPGVVRLYVLSGTTWTLQQALQIGHAGFPVSISGDTLVAGGSPSVQVFVRSGGLWTQQQRLQSPGGPAADDSFGFSVSVSGDTVVVGAPYADTASGVEVGSTYVFVRSGSAWTEEANLIAWVDSVAFDRFGFSVAVDGTTAVVGAYNDVVARGSAGSVSVFVRSGTEWHEQQKLTASDGKDSDEFGWSVSVSGDRIVVGAPGWGPYHDPLGGGPAFGAAYVFVRSGTTWRQTQRLTASDMGAGDHFGTSVSVAGEVIVVGAPADDGPPVADTGAAYVFTRSGGKHFSQRQKLTDPGGALEDQFGSSVAVSGETVVVGVPHKEVAAGAGAGSVQVFVRSGGAWTLEQELTASDGGVGDRFGASVSASGDTLVAGAPGAAGIAGHVQGAAYAFVRSGSLWTEQEKLVVTEAAEGEEFGVSVSVSGETAVVGGAYVFAPFGNVGVAAVFARSGSGWTEHGVLVPPGGGPGDQFGASVAVSGTSVLVGAPGDDTRGEEAGSAYVYRGAQADLEMTLLHGGAVVSPGGSVTYEMIVRNLGPDPVVGATVTDAYPSAVSCTTTCSGTGGATCTAGPFSGDIEDVVSLPVFERVTYIATCPVVVSATGTLVNVAMVAVPPTAEDPDPGNNSVTDTVTLVPYADLALGVTHSPEPATPGAPLGYVMTVANLGPSPSSGMTLSAVLPPDVTFVSSSPGPGICDSTGGSLACTLGGLSPGAMHTVSIDVAVAGGARGVLALTALADGNDYDPQDGNNADIETTLVSMPTQFFTVAPCRVVDTRGGSRAPIGGPALVAQSNRILALAGNCGIPGSAQAIALTVTVTEAGAPGNLRLFPAGLSLPLATVVSYGAGATRSNNATVALNANGEIAAYAAQSVGTTVHILIDVTGYFE